MVYSASRDGSCREDNSGLDLEDRSLNKERHEAFMAQKGYTTGAGQSSGLKLVGTPRKGKFPHPNIGGVRVK